MMAERHARVGRTRSRLSAGLAQVRHGRKSNPPIPPQRRASGRVEKAVRHIRQFPSVRDGGVMQLMMKSAIAFALAALSLAPVIRADDYDEGVKHFYVQCYICHWSNNPEKAVRPSTGLRDH